MINKPDSIIFKFKPGADYQSSCLLESKGNFALVTEVTTLHPPKAKLKFLLSGSLGIMSCSTSELPLFNEKYWNIHIARSVSTQSVDANQVYTLTANTVVSDMVTYHVSTSLSITNSLTSSYNGAYLDDAYFYVGGTLPSSSFYNLPPFIGDISSLKFYSEIITDDIFKEHCLSEFVVKSTNVTGSYESLVTYLRFEDNVDLLLTSSVFDSNVSAVGKNHGTAIGFSGNRFNTRYQKDVATVAMIGGVTRTQSKIKIDSSEPSFINSAYDLYDFNSNKTDFIFTPANIDNKNIIKFLNININEFVGNPEFLFSDAPYNELAHLYKYYRQYNYVIDAQQYINNIHKLTKPFFKNIYKFIPERTNFSGGVSIEPNILERTHIALNRRATVTNLTYTNIIPLYTNPIIDSLYIMHTASLSVAETVLLSTEYIRYDTNIVLDNHSIESEYHICTGSVYIGSDSELISDYLYKGCGVPIDRSDIIFSQGVKKKIIRYDNRISSESVENHFTYMGISNEDAKMVYIEPICNIKPVLTYSTGSIPASGSFYYKDMPASHPVVNYSSNVFYYDPSHIKYHIYDTIGRKRSRFLGTECRGPEHPDGATTLDGGKVIEITFTTSNTIKVVSADKESFKLRVDGIDSSI